VATVNGKIIKIEPAEGGFFVHVQISTDAVGALNFSVVAETKTIAESVEAAREILFALGGELAKKFEYKGSLQ